MMLAHQPVRQAGAAVSLRLSLRRAIPVCVFLLATLLILRGMSLGIPYLSPDMSSGSPVLLPQIGALGRTRPFRRASERSVTAVPLKSL